MWLMLKAKSVVTRVHQHIGSLQKKVKITLTTIDIFDIEYHIHTQQMAFTKFKLRLELTI